MPSVPPCKLEGTAFAVLGEALELILSRGASDLSINPRRISDILNSLVDRLHHSHDAPETTVTVAARLVAVPLMEITADPNLRLYRARQLVAPHKVRQQDTHCLQWLARQPGRSIREKLSARNRLMAVTRNLDPAKLEHSFGLLVCSRLEPLVRRYLDDSSSATAMGETGRHRLHLARQLRAAISEFRQFAANHGIPEPHNLPQPNNVLLHERRYRRVWLAARWLAEQDSRSQLLFQSAETFWQELVSLLAAAALQRLGYTFVETGYTPKETSANSANRKMSWVGLWFQATEHFFRKLSIQLDPNGDVLVWLLHTDSKSPSSKCFRITTTSRTGADWAMPLSSALRDGWDGLSCENELLFQAISEWLGTNPVPGGKSSDRVQTAATGLMRISALSLRFFCDGQIKCTHACAVGLNLAKSSEGFGPPLYLSGTEADCYRMFRRSGRTDFAGEPPLSDAVPWSWVVPGYFFRSCSTSQPFRVEARRSLLHSLVPATALRQLIVTAPHRLSYAALARFHDTLPTPLERKRIIPQPVALALAWREGHRDEPAENAWFGFLDLEAEFPDFALLQCKRLDPADNDLGWLRYPAFIRNQPPSLRWHNQLATTALARHRIPVSGGRVGGLLSQLAEADLIKVANGEQAAVHAWVRGHQDWRRVTVNQGDVLPVLQEWSQRVSTHVAREIEMRPQCPPEKVIVSGLISSVALVQQAFSNLPVSVDFTAQDLAPRGMSEFGRRLSEGLPTYRDFIPDLRISIRGADGHAFWHPLFAGTDRGREASVDRVLEGDEFAFSVPANTKSVRLPMKSDQERAEDDPIIRLESPTAADCLVLVRARYETAGRGLVLNVRSRSSGLIPPTELEWDNLGEESIDEEPPVLPERHHLSFKHSELLDAVDRFKQAFQWLGATRDHHAAVDLKQATKGLSRLLQRNVSSSSMDEWSTVKDSPSADALAELLARLAFLLEIGGRDSVSPVFERATGTFRRPASKVDLSVLGRDSELQSQLNFCLGRFAAAAPDGFIKHCLSTIDAPKTRSNVRQACIYSLGRSVSAWMDQGPRRVAAERIFATITEISHNGRLVTPEEWQEFGWWTRALAFFLAGNPWQISDIPISFLRTLVAAIVDAIAKLSAASCDDENAWSSLLASLLFVRYAMRIPEHGVSEFGPKSQLARSIVMALEQAACSSAVRSVARVNLRRFVQNPEVLQGENDFERVASIWKGKASGVLLRASVQDE